MNPSADITVLMSVFNGMPYLPAAVQSICEQTHENWIMVLVNDGSTDDSGAYLDSLDDPRFHVVHQENRGLDAALNRGLELCNTEFVARMDSDDISHPRRFERQLAFLRQHAEVGLVGTQYLPLGERRCGKMTALACDHDTLLAHILDGRAAILHPTIMCRTSLMKRIGGYWNQGYGEEWDLYLRLAEHTRLANLDEVLFSYRILSSSMTGSNMIHMRRRIAYTCECARRRRDGRTPIGFEQFVAQRGGEMGFVGRLAEHVEIHARRQYWRALEESLGKYPIRGYLRLGWAAACSPSLTFRRIARALQWRPIAVRANVV